MRKRLVRGSVLAATVLALCCTGASAAAADPDVFGETGAPASVTAPGAAPPPLGTDVPSPWGDLTGYGDPWPEAEAAVVRLVNKERSKAGCTALKVDTRLAEAAREHSHSLARDGSVSMTGFFPGSSARDRAHGKGYSRTAGEIVASGFETAEEAVKAWTRHTGPGNSLTNCDVKETGVGVVVTDRSTYWTQILGYGS
ncbi:MULTISPECIES: CAP domain-containing protein [unclassified Nocardiopsis]|uniref:CAP domain-containing protein n=1 Tax=unclassified Nocardiopsis TaxID=2649073 RepID=UPI0013572539|nr:MULTISPECIES: CAP domain-containing protein [unclassified Nocardiopsis]